MIFVHDIFCLIYGLVHIVIRDSKKRGEELFSPIIEKKVFGFVSEHCYISPVGLGHRFPQPAYLRSALASSLRLSQITHRLWARRITAR